MPIAYKLLKLKKIIKYLSSNQCNFLFFNDGGKRRHNSTFEKET